MARLVIGEIVGAGRGIEAGDHPAHDIVDMDAAEHLPRRMDALGGDAVERRAAGAVDAGQAEHARAKGEPLRIGLRAGGAAAGAGGGGLVDPCALRVAIDAG